MFAATFNGAAWFLPFVIPIGLWVAWSDMASMKIPNRAVLSLVAVYAAVGAVVLPFDQYLWQWLHLVIVLLAGFALTMAGMVGAGDAKFAAAMAPFVAGGDFPLLCLLAVAATLSAVLCHRLARSSPALRSLAPGWESWKRKDFPMGFALGPLLLIYLGAGIALGS